jgi:ribonuclease P protein component
VSDARPRGPASTQRQRFPRTARVRKRSDYLAIQNRGRRVAGPNLLLFGHPGAGRLGITVSRKVGGAVLRNRLKRWIRECWRLRRPSVPAPIDLVVVARPPAAGADQEALCREIGLLAGRLGIRLTP